MTIPTRLKRITAILLWLNLSGCAAVPVLLPKGDLLSPDAAREKFIGAERAEGLFRAFAHIEIRKGKKRYITNSALMLKRPSFIKIENLPLMGPPDLFLSAANGILKVFIPAKNRFYKGPASSENLALFLPFPMSPEDLTDTMLGIPPGISDGPVVMNEAGKDNGAGIDVFAGDGVRRLSLRMNRDINRLDGFDIYSPRGDILYSTAYKDYKKTGVGTFLPQEVTIVSPEAETAVSIRYSDMEIGTAADADLFDLPMPPGLQPIPLDRQGGHERDDD